MYRNSYYIYRDLAEDWEEIFYSTTLPNPFKYLYLRHFTSKSLLVGLGI